MSLSASSNLPKKDQVTITTTELPGKDHPFSNNAAKSIISRELTVFQKLLSSKALQKEALDLHDHESLTEEFKARKERDETIQPPTVKQMLTQDINPTSPMFNAEPFTPSPQGLCFATTSQSFWYQTTTPLLDKLLATPNINHICETNTLSSITTRFSPPWDPFRHQQTNRHPISPIMRPLSSPRFLSEITKNNCVSHLSPSAHKLEHGKTGSINPFL